MAPAWPDSPPPCTLTLMSKVSTWLVRNRGCLTIMMDVWRPKKASMSLSLIVILPVPFFMNTRATLDLRRPVPLGRKGVGEVKGVDLGGARMREKKIA